MVSDFVVASFDRFTAELLASVSSLPGVIGLVLMGSGAARSRLDEWSDHDFAVITAPGRQADFRDDLRWLPRFDRLVLVARDPTEGFKAVYDDGHVLEFDLASLDELATWRANDFEVILDRGGVAATMASIAAKQKPHATIDAEREIRLFLALLLIGVGRSRRGETLIAGAAIRNSALGHLVNLWQERMPASATASPDSLDNWRRFEFVYPETGSAIAAAVAQDVEAAARTLLDLAEAHLSPGWAEWPADAVNAVRRRLGW